MQTFVLEKGFGYKLFMIIAFTLFASVMYQGHILKGGIYSILFFAALALCSFQIVSSFYVLLVKRELEIEVNEDSISWKIKDNKKLQSQKQVKLKDIKELKTEVSYLTGNIYSRFTATFILKDNTEVVLTDGLLYDFGLKKAEKLCIFFLDNNLGEEQDIKFSKLIKQLNINLSEEQIFNKKDGKSYYVGVISKSKKEFLSLRLQLESLYKDYNKAEKNANNEYLIKNENIKDSFIYLRSNALGYFVEFYNVAKKEELKTLKQLGKRDKIGF